MVQALQEAAPENGVATKNEAAAAQSGGVHHGNVLHRRLRKRTETDKNGQKRTETDIALSECCTFASRKGKASQS